MARQLTRSAFTLGTTCQVRRRAHFHLRTNGQLWRTNTWRKRSTFALSTLDGEHIDAAILRHLEAEAALDKRAIGI